MKLGDPEPPHLSRSSRPFATKTSGFCDVVESCMNSKSLESGDVPGGGYSFGSPPVTRDWRPRWAIILARR